jgi:hypothetical protein
MNGGEQALRDHRSTIGGWIGWTLGARIGFVSAYTLGIVGTATGVYYGRRFADQLLDY